MKIDLVIYDFDGVMTNNKVLVHDNGSESAFCNRDDGAAVWKIKQLKISQFILTAEKNPIARHRAQKLEIGCILGCMDKAAYIIKHHSHILSRTLYVGNGLNDLEAMQLVKYQVCPADSHPKILRLVGSSGYGVISKRNGGDGVIQDVLDFLEKVK